MRCLNQSVIVGMITAPATGWEHSASQRFDMAGEPVERRGRHDDADATFRRHSPVTRVMGSTNPLVRASDQAERVRACEHVQQPDEVTPPSVRETLALSLVARLMLMSMVGSGRSR